jgi:PAS domain S-box-containing protein
MGGAHRVNAYAYALVGFTAIVAVLIGFLSFAVFRFAAGVRDTRQHLGAGGAETAFLSAALQEAVQKLKNQEQAMSARAAASEQLSAQLVESLTAGLLVTDGNGRVRILNPAGQRMLGVTGDPVGQDLRAALASTSPLVAVVEECLATGESIHRRSVAMPATSRATHFGVSASPLGNASDGNGVICLFSDLTTVYDLEEQLRTRDTLARLGELTAGIAHEFRNGLATIHGYSRLIDLKELPGKYEPYVEGIRQETEALGAVVANFLNFARPEHVSLTVVDIGGVIRMAVDDIRHELPAGTTVTVEGEFGTIDGDDMLLRQVFTNLLRNAAEAAADAGRDPAITFSGMIDAARAGCVVCVDDNGPGIPLDMREKVFRPFFTSRSRGTGLGLAIVQKIVVTLAGRVVAEESPRGGARFRLSFRLAA